MHFKLIYSILMEHCFCDEFALEFTSYIRLRAGFHVNYMFIATKLFGCPREVTGGILYTGPAISGTLSFRAIPFKNGEGGRWYFFCIGGLKNAILLYMGSRKCHFFV